MQLLDDPPERVASYSAEALDAMSRLVEIKLKDFGVDVEVVAVQFRGPVITRFEMQPSPGTKASQISGLSKDLARALSVISVRVVEVIPGKPVMGLEIPNERARDSHAGRDHQVAGLRGDQLAAGDRAGQGTSPATPSWPTSHACRHLLIAGTTGSGKSVGINAMVLSLLYKSTAEHVRMIMIDPKMLELSCTRASRTCWHRWSPT